MRIRRDGFELDIDVDLAGGLGPIVLLGPNGSGKSTVAHALAGLLPLDEGRVSLDDVVLENTSDRVYVPPEERSIGVIFQDLALFPHLSALENAAFPLRARGVPRARALAQASELLNELGLTDPVHQRARPGRLSGGQAQRVALARALIHRPRMLLLDEPTSSLDVGAQARIRDLLARILSGFDGITVLITHDPVEAMTLGRWLIVLENGRVLQEGTPQDLREHPGSPYVADLVGANPSADDGRR
jgi:molybdate transport system ATP-binding protein